MMKNPMINGTIDDFQYKEFLSVDDVIAKEEFSANPNFGEPEFFNEQTFFVDQFPNSSSASHEAESHENSDIYSDLVLDFIGQMLMEEDMDDKFDMLESHPALEATEKPFYEIIGEKYPPSPDRPPLYSSTPSSESSESHRSLSFHSSSITGVNGFADNNPESTDLLHSRIYSSQTSISSQYDVSSFLEGFEADPDDFSSDLFFKTLPASQFEKGVEEALKFLPSEDKLVVDAGAIGFDFPQEPKEDLASIEDKAEEARGRRPKGRHDDISLDSEEQRSSKQSAISYEEPPEVSSEMFDMVFLCSNEKFPKMITTLREAMKSEAASKNPPPETITQLNEKGRKSRNKKKQPKKEVVDLQNLLMQCAQTVASGDHHRAYELLKQIRHHSSPYGDAWQRLAHYFADGLEARLAGTGSAIYNALVSKRKTASDVLKAYQVYLAASPFKTVSYHFSNQTIFNAIGSATRVHILDYGIYFGFQWPPFMKMLSARPGGPPKLRISGIDVPQPGFRPAERIEETGRRLHHYAERFRIPFEYQVVASKLDEVKVEDLRLEEDELLIVNCVFRINSLSDDAVDADCPRDKFLSGIRKLNPALFVNVTSSGNYGAPFFVTRFREALYYFSAMFDMLEMTVPRENDHRLLVERDLYGKLAINIISCEGADRLERPETYKQTQLRCLRAGLEQLPINSEITKMVKCGVRVHYHKDFSVDEDGRWLLLGWRGRICIGLSAWKPRYY